MQKTFDQRMTADILIAGGGLAAFQAANVCAEAGLSVVMVVERTLCSGSSFYPLTAGLGCQAPAGEEDKQWFMEELQDSGAGMQDDALSEIYINEIRDRIEELPRLGIRYGTPEGRRACFAKRERTLACWYGLDQQGAVMKKQLRSFPNVTVLEYCDVVKLLTKEGRVAGAVLCDDRARLYHVRTGRVILATGGYAGLYKHSLNTDDVCGTGHGIALDAGAKLVNMEFIQFIPGAISPVYKLLFSEMTLQFCDGVLNQNGEDILKKYLPSHVTERQCLDSRGGHGPFTCRDESGYFDIAMMSEILRTGDERGFRLVYSPKMFEEDNFFVKEYIQFAKDQKVDLLRDDFRVAPFGHAANGGILIDGNARTTVEGLYAAGESAGGLHGADRHGGNASGSCLVFGRRAARSAIEDVQAQPSVDACTDKQAMEGYEEMLHSGKSGSVSPEETMAVMGSVLWKNCNVVRTEQSLEAGLAVLRGLSEQYNAAMLIRAGTSPLKAIKARHCLMTAGAVMTAANLRKESRGAHYRADYPGRDDEHYGVRQILTLEQGVLRSHFDRKG